MYLRRVGIGQLLFASSFALIGAISLGLHDFLLNQQPVPSAIPWRETLACLSALLMLLPGIGLLFAPTARGAALVLTGFVFLWVIALQLPRLAAHPLVEANWLGVGEDMALVTGGWVLHRAVAGHGEDGIRIARRLFGLALVPIGLSHFVYFELAESFIPAWMPWHGPLTLLSGAGHVMAGLAIAFGVVPRLAATMEASMETLITLIVWVSAVVLRPDHRSAVNLLISTAESAAAWIVAASYESGILRGHDKGVRR